MSVYMSGLGGNPIFQLLIKIQVYFFMCRFLSYMETSLIYKHLFYKYILCLFDGYAIKDITVNIVKKVSFFKNLFPHFMITMFFSYLLKV